MGDELTPEDLARLNARLDRLPGFDAVGLWLHHGSSRLPSGTERAIVAGRNEAGDLLLINELDGDGASMTWWKPDASGWLSTADASTRDRLARWIAERCGYEDRHRGLFYYIDWAAGLRAFYLFGPSRGGMRWNGVGHEHDTSPVVPALVDFTPAGPGVAERLLPDGSRWVDAAALAAVAVHLGTTA